MNRPDGVLQATLPDVSYGQDESSVSQNRPIELYTITTSTATYQHTSHPADVPYGGGIFTALTMDRGSHQLANDQGVDEMTITLPISHPIVQGFAATGIPELSVMVTVQRLQSVSGVAVQIWKGPAQSMSVDGHLATIRVPASTADALKIQLPVIGATRVCNHRLFDSRCSPVPGGLFPPFLGPAGSGGPTPALFTVTDLVSSISTDGLTVTMTAGGVSTKPGGWAAFGRLILASGEQRRILAQVGATITLAVALPGLSAGTSVSVEAGCLHSITACKTKFNNQLNFGGHPLMTTFNAWATNGLGVIQQV